MDEKKGVQMMGGGRGGGGSSSIRVKADLTVLGKVSMVAAGIQFGWALQLSLLTPYVQELGIPHQYASFIWLCGPISGLIVQPVVGVWSDECGCRWGRRRPFILIGALMVAIAVMVIGFSADIGHLLGDSPTSPGDPRPRACLIFVVGFWLLDLANNTVQGPARALLADLAGRDPRLVRAGNAFFSAWIALGQILGYSTGAYAGWDKVFPFTRTDACGHACANLKTAFGLAVLFLVTCTTISLISAKEVARGTMSANGATVPKEKKREASVISGGRLLAPEVSDTTTPLLKEARWQEQQESAKQRTGEGGVDGGGNNEPYHLSGGDDRTATEAKTNAQSYTNMKDGQEEQVSLSVRAGSDGHFAESSNGSHGGGRAGSEFFAKEEKKLIAPCLVEEEEKSEFALYDLIVVMKFMPRQIWFVLAVTALTWLAWFPFLLFDTDWMGREVYGGSPSDGPISSSLYDMGVHMGSVGLLVNSVVLGIVSLAIEPLCRKFLSRWVWTVGNFLLFVCMATTFLITHAASQVVEATDNPVGPPTWVKTASIAIFGLLGIPLAITYSVPYSMMALHTCSMGGGQGFSMGVLNLAVVIPQMFISCLSGPWDELFGGGNEPAFLAAAVFALLGAIVGAYILPNPPPSEHKTKGKNRSSSFLSLAV